MPLGFLCSSYRRAMAFQNVLVLFLTKTIFFPDNYETLWEGGLRSQSGAFSRVLVPGNISLYKAKQSDPVRLCSTHK
jgi:hypothetical protein